MSYDEKISSLKAALEKRGLPAGWHSKIMDAMAECGMTPGAVHAVNDDTRLAKTLANYEGLKAIHARCAMDLARLQIAPPKSGVKLDTFSISAAAKSQGWPTQRVMELKASLAAINWL